MNNLPDGAIDRVECAKSLREIADRMEKGEIVAFAASELRLDGEGQIQLHSWGVVDYTLNRGLHTYTLLGLMEQTRLFVHEQHTSWIWRTAIEHAKTKHAQEQAIAEAAGATRQ